MKQKNDYMILTILKGITIFFKTCATYFLGIAIITPIAVNQENSDLLFRFLESVPSQIAMAFGILYLVIVLLKKASDLWAHHKMNMDKIKSSSYKTEENKQSLEQKKIETYSKRNEH